MHSGIYHGENPLHVSIKCQYAMTVAVSSYFFILYTTIYVTFCVYKSLQYYECLCEMRLQQL